MTMSRLALGCVGALVFGGLAAAPAAAQRITSERGATMNAMIVLGESPARACYESAAAGSRSATAVEECNRALSGDLLRSDRAATHVNRAVLREIRGDLEGAAADLREAIAIAPDLLQAHVNLGSVYMSLERWADARASLDRAIALAPAGHAEAHFMRAAAREELGDVAGAYADYQRAAELAPEWELPRTELGRFRVVTDGDGGA